MLAFDFGAAGFDTIVTVGAGRSQFDSVRGASDQHVSLGAGGEGFGTGDGVIDGTENKNINHYRQKDENYQRIS